MIQCLKPLNDFREIGCAPAELNGEILYVTLAAVTVCAKHLTVFRSCLSTLTPRRDMVSLHFFYFKMFSAFGADTFLPLISCPCHFRRESTNI